MAGEGNNGDSNGTGSNNGDGQGGGVSSAVGSGGNSNNASGTFDGPGYDAGFAALGLDAGPPASGYAAALDPGLGPVAAASPFSGPGYSPSPAQLGIDPSSPFDAPGYAPSPAQLGLAPDPSPFDAPGLALNPAQLGLAPALSFASPTPAPDPAPASPTTLGHITASVLGTMAGFMANMAPALSGPAAFGLGAAVTGFANNQPSVQGVLSNPGPAMTSMIGMMGDAESATTAGAIGLGPDGNNIGVDSQRGGN